ncbi:MAG: DUF3078 domain-containing protein [Sediminibacterium sp.]|nr:DUF3078 domain-containing protein [Sediminibacterium sp.]
MTSKISIIFLLVLIFNINFRVAAQDTTTVSRLKNLNYQSVNIPDSIAKDSSNWKWQTGGLFNFILAQGTNSNWSAGGTNFSLSTSAYYNHYFIYRYKRKRLEMYTNVSEGFIQASDVGGRKIDDRVEFLAKYGYKIDTTKNWFISGLINFRSQLFDGLNYYNDTSVLTSTFLSPAYTVFSLGFDHKVFKDNLSIFYSPTTLRFTYVNSNYLRRYGGYSVDTNSGYRGEVGLYVSLIYINTFLNQAVQYRGRLDVFFNYLNNPENAHFIMTNYLQYRVSRNFNFNISLDMIYDDDIRQFGPNGNSAALQLRSQIGIGYAIPIKNIKKTVN